MVERETVVEAVVATIGVAVLVAALVAAGGTGGSTGEQGGLVMVGGIFGFLLFMAAAGYWLSTRH